jgi:hypothetical protein
MLWFSPTKLRQEKSRCGGEEQTRTDGVSAPLKELQRKFGFEPDCEAAATQAQLGRT